MGLPDEDLVRRLRNSAAELAELEARVIAATERRDALILEAIRANVPRVQIAKAADLSEPMIYKIRREKGGAGDAS